MRNDMAVIHKGMEVWDAAANRIGTIGRVYSTAPFALSEATRDVDETENYVRIDTGFLGLGKKLWVPAAIVQAINDDTAMLHVEKARVRSMGWDTRPSTLVDVQ